MVGPGGLPSLPSALAAKMVAGGAPSLDALPTSDEVAALPIGERRELLAGLRPELYAMATVLADGTIRRADRARPSYPPYGLARSMFSQLRMVNSSPQPFEAGSIDNYDDLGRATVDTMVFHLSAELTGLRTSERRWMLDRTEQLLSLFRSAASPTRRARIRDVFSFMYGGLHFGTSVCVQMVEVMSRVLDDWEPAGSCRDKATVITRSIRAVSQLMALDVDNVARAYQQLQSSSEGRRPVSAVAPSTRWLAAGHFVVHAPSGRPHRIDLRTGALPAGTGLGCPARVSLAGAPSAVATLWRWSVEAAEASGLLSRDCSPGMRN